MKLTILGSGTGVPSVERSSPGYYLEVSGLQILVDCGSGTLRQLERTGKSYKDIDAVFITHSHPDHITDLITLFHAIRATPNFVREKDLTIVGSHDFKKFYVKNIMPLFSSPKTFQIALLEIEEKLDFQKAHVFSKKMIHSADSIAYRFEEWDKSIVITGDCDYDQGIIDISLDADLLVIDCSFPNALKVAGHLTPSECGRIAKQAQVKKLVLSHIYPGDYTATDLLNECKSVFEGSVVVAEDLMNFDIS